jgi:uncharacterized membrane protein
MKITKLLLAIRQNFWFLPFLYGCLAFLLSILSIWIEKTFSAEQIEPYIPNVLLTDIEVSETILSSLAISILTMTTITFSSIMVVLTTYSSQFSPRTLQDFISDRITQRVLGVFVGGFIYSVFMLLFLKEIGPKELFIAPAIAVLLAVICLAFFVFFIQHVATWIQVNNLIDEITRHTLTTIHKTYKDSLRNHEQIASTDKWEIEELERYNKKEINAGKSGYLQLINVHEMVKYATKDDIIIRIDRQIGEYIVKDTPIISYWTHQAHHKEVSEKKYLEMLAFGTERTTVQDIEFGLQKLVEIALRAISPAINDPHTAINCINRIGTILCQIGKATNPEPNYFDQHHNLRVIMEIRSFTDFLYKSFYQIRHYGKNDISVTTAIITALQFIAESNDQHIKNIVWEFSRYIIAGCNKDVLLPLDKDYLNHKIKNLAAATGHQRQFEPLQ